MTIYNVSGQAQLSTALAQAKGGDEIRLAGGDYGQLNLLNKSYGSEVIVRADNPATPPTFSKVALWNVDNLTLDGITVNFVPDAGTVEWSAAVRTDISSNISLLNSVVTGGPSVAGIPANSPAGSQGSKEIMGEPIGYGIFALNTPGLRVENNTISEFSAGARIANSDGLVFNGNEIFNVRNVPVSGANVDNVHMEGNYLHDLNPWKHSGAGDHADFVHFWTTSKQSGPNVNYMFRDNYFAQGDGAAPLGIYLDDDNNGRGFRNVSVIDNVIHNAGTAGAMLMEDVVGLKVLGNTFLQSSGTTQNAPSMLLAAGTRDVEIDGNILAGVIGPALSNAAGNNIRIGNNMTAQIHDPDGANYAGDIFLNGIAANPSLADLRPMPGGPAASYGAQLGDQGTSGVDGFIVSQPGAELALSTHGFSLFDMNSSNGNALASGAQVTWTFGDGTSGSGAQLAHHYNAPGTYDVTATVRVPASNGSFTTYQVAKTVEVHSPLAIQADFQSGGATDSAPEPHMAQMNGTVKFVTTEKGQSVRLEGYGSTIKYLPSNDILKNSEFTVSVGFRKDVGAESGTGRILYFSETAVVEVGSNGITLRGTTSNNETIVLSGNNLGVRDSQWHQVAYTFSQTDGQAILYVDGQEVDRMEGLTGHQKTTFNHGLHVGNPFGSNLKGVIDDAVFLRASLSPAEISSDYTTFAAHGTPDYALPSAGGGTVTPPSAPEPATPVVETPVVETPVVETPVVETPVVVTPPPVVVTPPPVVTPPVVAPTPVTPPEDLPVFSTNLTDKFQFMNDQALHFDS